MNVTEIYKIPTDAQFSCMDEVHRTMAVARGVQGGALAPPSATRSLEKKYKDYSNWIGINKIRTICL